MFYGELCFQVDGVEFVYVVVGYVGIGYCEVGLGFVIEED